MEKEVAVVVGVGPGLGAALARCFAGAGMDVAVAARDGNRLEALARELSAMGVSARAYGCDAGREADVDALFERAGRDLGEPALVVFNAGAFVRKGIVETDSAEFERCWRIGCLGGFHVGRAAAKAMLRRLEAGGAGGTILFTGATASLRGSALFHNLAVPKFGLRALAQSMARELSPKGIHVAHAIVDGQIDAERHAHLRGERPPDGLLSPDAIAANYLHLHRQHRSAWTHELDLRPWVERF